MEVKENYPLDLVSGTIWTIGTALGLTWRFKFHIPPSVDPYSDFNGGVIYCFWHSQLLSLAYAFRNTGKTAVVSESHDGRRAAAVARHWNHDIIAGSSSHGGMAALRNCVKALKRGKSIVITPDGPRGPREVVKAGVAQIALISSSQVVAVTARPKRAWKLRSWDRFVIPRPFTTIDVILSEPIDPGQFSESKEPVESLREAIQSSLRSQSDVAS